LEGMKKAYAVGLYGDDPRVIDGAWRELFPDKAEGPTEGRAFPDAVLGNGSASSANGKEKAQRKPDAKEEGDGAVPEQGAEVAETGAEGNGGDGGKKGINRTKRTGVQGTLDMPCC
jgi:cryptochrome